MMTLSFMAGSNLGQVVHHMMTLSIMADSNLEEVVHYTMILSFMAGSNFEVDLTQFRTSPLNPCTSMKHACPTYSHIIFQMLLTH
jgi:hypothetical protein